MQNKLMDTGKIPDSITTHDATPNKVLQQARAKTARYCAQ